MSLAQDVQAQTQRNVSWADNSIKDANTFLDRLSNITRFRSLSYSDPVSFSEIAFNVDSITDKFTKNITIESIPSFNKTYTAGSIYTPSVITVPALNVAAPAINLPLPPSAALPNQPAMPPVLENIVTPNAPLINLPSIPTIKQVNIPQAPTIELPKFTAILPDLKLSSPNINFEYNEVPYSSELLTKLSAFLSKKLDGGTGLNSIIEEQLWDRARAREAATNEANITNAIEGMAALGFDAPTGSVQQKITQAQNEAELKNAALSRDISIEQAKLEQENDKIYAAASQQFEGMLIQHFDNVSNRALDVEKSRIQFAISLFDTHVAQYNAEISKYQAQAQVFSQLVQGALANAQIYRTQIESAKLEVEVQSVYVDLYRAQLQGVDSLVGIYRTEMDAANIRTQIERNKVEAFRAQISSYQSLVQAKVAEFGMYTAQVDGEKAKVSIYSEQVRAFSSEVEAQKAVASIEESKVRASVAAENSNIASYKADIDGYMVKLKATDTSIRANIGYYEADMKAFDVGVRAKIANSEIRLKEADLKVKQELSKVEFSTTNAIETTKRFVKEAEMDIDAAKFGSNLYAKMAQSAASGITSIIQTGAQEITQP